MNVNIDEVSQNVYVVRLDTVDPDLFALVVRAETAADEAELSAQEAATSETNASDSAQSASQSATNAATSEQNASNSADAASLSAVNASQSASDASDSASAAGQSANEALGYRNQSEGFATDASNSADSAATSEANAGQSAQDASQSASTATDEANRAEQEADRAASIADRLYQWYGVEWDVTVADPAVTRIGNMSHHRNLPIQSKMRRCLLLDDGTVNYYLDANDSSLREDGVTSANLDGADGQVMVEIPEHFVRFETDGDIRRVLLSTVFMDGFKRVPKAYVGAFKATVYRPDNLLSSVASMSPDYRGGNNNAVWDEEDRSLLGKAASSISRTGFRNYARNRGSNNWNCMLHSVRKSLIWLYVVEYANRNSQLPINPALTAEGFRQGGLGNGVTTVTNEEWISFNSRYSFVPCGTTTGLGNITGETPYTVPGWGVSVNVPSYRGVENIFGELFEWTDGINVRVQSDDDGGQSQVYVTEGLDFSDTGYEGYEMVGLMPRNDLYITDVIFGDTGDIMSRENGGSGSTYWCDRSYGSSVPATGEAIRGVLAGGSAYSGALAGLSFSYTFYSPSLTSAFLGSRLCFITD